MSLLDWNSIVNSRHGITFSCRVQSKFSRSQWSSFASTCLEGTVPHLEFSIEIQSNNLTYQGNPYTAYQQYLYTLIKCLHDKGYGYRRIAHKLNTWQVKTARGNRWYNTSVTSVLKRKHQRDARIEQIRQKEFPVKIGKFRLTYYTF